MSAVKKDSLKLWQVTGMVSVFIFLVTAWMRFFHLGNLPAGFTWDEAFLGYVGKMVWLTGADEHLNRFPVVFQSFGDYKAPLAVYISGFFTSIFGLNEWAVRLPFALAGVLTVAAVGVIVWKVFRNAWLGLLGAWLLAITPWHIVLSRVGFESGLALFSFAMLITSWLFLRDTVSEYRWRVLAWATLVVSTVSGLYVYHSTKIVFPLTFTLIGTFELCTHRTWWVRQWKLLLGSMFVGTLLLLPLLWTTFTGNGATRAEQTLIFSQAESVTQAIRLFLNNVAIHLSPAFLVQGQTPTLRHGLGDRGVFYSAQVVLLGVGALFTLARPIEQYLKKKRRPWFSHLFPFAVKSQESNGAVPSWIWLVLFFICLLPAALGFEVPHANRALLAILPAILLMVTAVREFELELPGIAFPLAAAAILLVMVLEWASFWKIYTTEYLLRSSTDWLDGYEQVADFLYPYTLKNSKILMTKAYGEPEVFFGFYWKTPVQQYQSERIPNVTFGSLEQFDAQQFDIIVTETEDTTRQLPLINTITRVDGSPAFYVYGK